MKRFSLGLTIGALALAVVAAVGLARVSAGVSVHVFQFQPGTVDVDAGEPVTWTNGDDIEHTITAGQPEQRSALFDLRLPGRGASATFTFTEPGGYHYFCGRHPRCAARSASTDWSPRGRVT